MPAIRPAWYKYLWSYVLGWKETTIDSAYSGTLELWWMNGRLVLNTLHANYSYDTLHRAFREALQKCLADRTSPETVLLLGMGGGSVIDILHQERKLDCHITAVEIDPVVTEIARTCFGIQNGPLLQVTEADAYTFVQECLRPYDLVILDIFIDATIPGKFTEPVFTRRLSSCVAPGGLLLCNCMDTRDAEKIMAELPGASVIKTRTGNTMVYRKNKTGNP